MCWYHDPDRVVLSATARVLMLHMGVSTALLCADLIQQAQPPACSCRRSTLAGGTLDRALWPVFTLKAANPASFAFVLLQKRVAQAGIEDGSLIPPVKKLGRPSKVPAWHPRFNAPVTCSCPAI